MAAIVDVLKEKLNVSEGQTIDEVLKSGMNNGGGGSTGFDYVSFPFSWDGDELTPLFESEEYYAAKEAGKYIVAVIDSTYKQCFYPCLSGDGEDQYVTFTFSNENYSPVVRSSFIRVSYNITEHTPIQCYMNISILNA